MRRTAVFMLITLTMAGCGWNGSSMTSSTTITSSVETTLPGTTTTETSSPTPVKLKAGDIIVVPEHGKEVGTVQVVKVSSRAKTNSPHGKAPTHGRYLTFVLKLVAEPGQRFGVDPFAWYIRGADGTRYIPAAGNASMESADGPKLETTTLKPGKKTTGTITFDIPTGNVSLVYAPLASVIAEWPLTVS